MKILFVCSGNTCRSPLAEAIARREGIERGMLDVDVESAGTSAYDGAPASDGSMLVALERRLNIGAHQARLLTRDLVEQATLILTMAPAHLEQVIALGGEGKAVLLTDYAHDGRVSAAIQDPYGGDLATYRATADELSTHIRLVFDRLSRDRASAAT